jgi:hypothetical protein
MSKLSLVVVAGAAFALGADARHHPEGTTAETMRLVADDAVISVLHVRVQVRANDVAGFQLDRITLVASGVRVHPVAVNADVPTLPVAILDRGVTVTADLFFVVPREVESFMLLWPARDATVETVALRAGTAVDAGSTWWFDPNFSWPRFYHRPGIAKPRPPLHATVEE